MTAWGIGQNVDGSLLSGGTSGLQGRRFLVSVYTAQKYTFQFDVQNRRDWWFFVGADWKVGESRIWVAIMRLMR